VSIPQRLNFVTLGAWSVDRLRAFYASWGWMENDGSSSEYASFTAGSVRLALYPLERLAAEAAPGEDLPSQGGWSGVTLAINFDSREAVDHALIEASAAGAKVVQPGTTREWGGYSAYVADPEGTRWELAWAPGFDPDAR
jgi:predicted lactoylglutathione lyase